jgi:Asp-tRNA(Asn)/Glu-tRNA(Gln) amidotransferase A subunit family amidase
MRVDEYLLYDAIGLADLVRRKQISPLELLHCAIGRTATTNPKVNAVIEQCVDQASEAIERGLPPGPLCGVPFLIKDARIEWKGLRTTNGARSLADTPPAETDGALAADLRASGLVAFGTTNMPEFGLNPVTEPVFYGPTHNPWNLNFSAGGSSGGAAAAVAAGMVPVAHGNDGGGSLRIPAAACGLFAMKPTRGRISMAPAGEGWGGMSTHGFISRTVRDSALLLDLVCQPKLGDPYWRDPPAKSFSSFATTTHRPLRIGVYLGALLAERLAPDCEAAVSEAADLCSALGHNVEAIDLKGDWEAFAEATRHIVAVNIHATLERLGRSRCAPIQAHDVEFGTWAVAEIGKSLSPAQYVTSLQYLHDFTRRFVVNHASFDVLLSSTIGHQAPPIGFFASAERTMDDIYRWMPNTNLFNVTGQPAMTVPWGLSADHLPLGVQFAAGAGEEGLLFRLAGQIEEAKPWPGIAPNR